MALRPPTASASVSAAAAATRSATTPLFSAPGPAETGTLGFWAPAGNSDVWLRPLPNVNGVGVVRHEEGGVVAVGGGLALAFVVVGGVGGMAVCGGGVMAVVVGGVAVLGGGGGGGVVVVGVGGGGLDVAVGGVVVTVVVGGVVVVGGGVPTAGVVIGGAVLVGSLSAVLGPASSLMVFLWLFVLLCFFGISSACSKVAVDVAVGRTAVPADGLGAAVVAATGWPPTVVAATGRAVLGWTAPVPETTTTGRATPEQAGSASAYL